MCLPRAIILLLLYFPTLVWAAEQYDVKVTAQKPQPSDNFVQGLEILDNYLYVSTGLYGNSRLLRYRFPGGQLESERALDKNFFAEGLTVLGDTIYQLTWQNRKMLLYNKSNLAFQKSLPLTGEGWGLTNNGKDLIYSDGTAKLRFISPDTGKVKRTVTVTLKGRPVLFLNELEWIDGAIWANVWQRDWIVIINPSNGNVAATVDLRGLRRLLPQGKQRQRAGVLNGIAKNPVDGSIWVTGKYWPRLYQIELIARASENKAQ